jgi:hypothetical protein
MTKKEREYLQGLEAHNERQAEQIKEMRRVLTIIYEHGTFQGTALGHDIDAVLYADYAQ